jgi:hypothetical protein
MITEALPKNSRYSTSKAEFNLEGYDLFPEKFPIQDTRGILVYIKQDLKAVKFVHETIRICINTFKFSQKFKILSTSNI